jgi:CrcB protein
VGEPLLLKLIASAENVAEVFSFSSGDTNKERKIIEVIYIAVAGAAGALARYYVGGFAQRGLGTAFPYGTLIVNLLGSFLIGFIMQAGINTDLIPRTVRVALTIGFLGAFTTFSTLGYETLGYLRDGAWLLGISNILLNLVPGLLAVLLGAYLAQTLLGGV